MKHDFLQAHYRYAAAGIFAIFLVMNTQSQPRVARLQPHHTSDFAQLIALFEDVFEMPAYERPTLAHLEKLLAQPDFFVLAAYVNDQLVGGLTAYVWDQYYSDKKLAYVYDLAVLPMYQRKGVGRLLMAEIQHRCREAGFAEVFVQAEQEDTHALDFYRATGGVEQAVSHFSYRL